MELTRKENEILSLIARGLIAKEIAIMLDTSEQAIKNKLLNIRRKLKARNTAEAVYKYYHVCDAVIN